MMQLLLELGMMPQVDGMEPLKLEQLVNGK
jgi:hypothetical protein